MNKSVFILGLLTATMMEQNTFAYDSISGVKISISGTEFSTDNEGKQGTWSYDKNGNLIGDNKFSYEYTNGKLSKITDKSDPNIYSEFHYDSFGNLDSESYHAKNGSVQDREINNTYENGILKTSVTGSGQTITYADNGKVLSEIRSYSDAFGIYATSENYYTYYDDGKLKYKDAIDREGSYAYRQAFYYDENGRLEKIGYLDDYDYEGGSLPDPAALGTCSNDLCSYMEGGYSYNEDGTLKSKTNVHGNERYDYKYDEYGNLEEVARSDLEMYYRCVDSDCTEEEEYYVWSEPYLYQSYIYEDKNWKANLAKAATRTKHRIYTVEEASKLSKPTGNTFKLRYR